VYWSIRARRYGERGVLNLAHAEDDAPTVLARQRSILEPLLDEHLRASDKLALDFGCGPGRFTPVLASKVGHAIGVDPVAKFLELAPEREGVEYRQIKGGVIPAGDDSVDVVWVCLVLGNLTRQQDFDQAISEIKRVLRPGGLLFLVENTTSGAVDGPTQVYRSADAYRQFMSFADLTPIGTYDDLGETMTILAGRGPG
jgi:ubiquinone/menaquinone biosynthesis C-methylase UbiE